jgi:pimeloyl-ACP methyl ester carboxylesterase
MLALRASSGRAPTVVFLGGLGSAMTGTKATFLESHCCAHGRAYVRFDYRGHGTSGGRLEEGCIGDWLADTLAVLDGATDGRLVLGGSSLGGWLALLAGLARPGRVVGLVLVAAAPDFTESLIRAKLTEQQRSTLAVAGVVRLPSAYGDPLPVTRRLIEEGGRHLLLGAPIPLHCPIHLLHGQQDPDVPWTTSLDLAARLESGRVTVELVKDGDHRLSRDGDLRRLAAALVRVLEQAG